MVRSVYETIMYAKDVPAAAAFYADVLGIALLRLPTSLSAALRLTDGGVLLIFNPDESSKPNRVVPSHGYTSGCGHLAFRIAPGTYDQWKRTLVEKGVAIEQEASWGVGAVMGGTDARSIYFRDPAGNAVELVEGEIWMR